MPNKELIKVKVLELADNNDIYMTLKLLLITSNVNLNKAIFDEDFIHEICENKSFYISGIPLVVERSKLEAGKYQSLGHGLNKSGQLISDVIGAFADFEEAKAEDGSWELYGTAKVYKRYPLTCQALTELYEAGDLEFSVEALVYEYEKLETGERKVNRGKGTLCGQAVVSNPAEKKSVATLLVAEAYNKDLGGEEMPKVRDINLSCEEMFEGAKVYFENSELDMGQIRSKIYTQLKNVFKDDWYNYDISFMFMSYIIVKDYNKGDYYKISFDVGDSEVTIGEPIKCTIQFVEVAEQEEKNKMEFEKLQAELEIANAKIVVLETEVAQFKTVIESKDVEIATLNEQIVKVGENLAEKDTLIASLEVYKTQIESAEAEKIATELTQKKTDIKAKCEKILTAEEMTELAEAIETLDENKINSVLAAKYVEMASKSKPETPKAPEKSYVTASRMTDEIKLNSNDVVSKYITIS